MRKRCVNDEEKNDFDGTYFDNGNRTYDRDVEVTRLERRGKKKQVQQIQLKIKL